MAFWFVLILNNFKAPTCESPFSKLAVKFDVFKLLALSEIEQKLSGVIEYTSHNIFVKTEFHFDQEFLRYPSEDHDII